MDKKSPLKAPPLRLPGQSVQDEIDKLIDDSLMPTYIFAVMMLMMCLNGWWIWYSQKIPSPFLMTVIAVLAIGYATWKIVSSKNKLKSLKLARDGERAVAQFLERLRVQGFDVYHDIIGDNFNVDHVAIGPSGVYTIETKTNSKPAKGEAKVFYDGNSITVNDFTPDRDPIVQAKAQANWIKETLKESTGKTPPVKSVVVYPGWWIDNSKAKNPEVWVLNPKALPTYLENADDVISIEDQQLFSFHLSRYIRSTIKMST